MKAAFDPNAFDSTKSTLMGHIRVCRASGHDFLIRSKLECAIFQPCCAKTVNGVFFAGSGTETGPLEPCTLKLISRNT